MAVAKKRPSVGSKRPVPPRRSPTPRGVGRKKTLKAKAKAVTDPDQDRLSYIRGLIRDVPDFPSPGIVFKDITPLLADARGFHMTIDSFAEQLIELDFDTIVGIESRGFIFGAPLALRLNKRFVPIRKPGKLPWKSDRVSYELEYGSGELEIHRDAVRKGSRVVIIDDLLATGGTAGAAAELVGRRGGLVVSFAFVIELGFLGGARKLGSTRPISLLQND